MSEIMVRVVAESFDAWLKTHYEHVDDRRAHGMTDGPVYRDIDNPNAALFHIHVEDLARAMEWFRSDTFRDATKRATVTDREFYMAERREAIMACSSLSECERAGAPALSHLREPLAEHRHDLVEDRLEEVHSVCDKET